ncbi:hypothetical protein SEA_LILPHARAOH_76 [Mycobacterium phage LilPharaoh]|uniref:SsDNA binding protein n=1 Tax=Mycobacterium phage Amelie TaxID=1913035 RepID=A0A1J0GQE4_9CAUD|nr:hypothetical protein AVV01_gp77 [Mycobacterium phage Enkosi]YP_009952593.1 hypothetical protein I5G92_gp75 [Mycobacterium phage Amelie]ATN90529.1 hypothetical protein SEA_LILPHARAOH_76 [Mycobacterium phage LilPharaoh]AVP42653.1 hypothetical protein SEA_SGTBEANSPROUT_76 [Mycobacterium phage SgtBeansprout]AXC37181.1 hypothetical protein SEA_BIGLEBOPS_75 [Mycobacterium phage Biglebops]QGJ93360.1 hypothetical protein PBI_MDAVU_76 [Mycobacterium phage Mdavu]UQS94475.1 DNA binding protein [Mycob
MSTTFKYQGRTFELHTYVDPHPGKHGHDRVYWTEDCCRCGGSGIYRWVNHMGKCEGTCYGCWGTGKVERQNAVQTLRRYAKLDALWAEYGDQLAAEAQAEAAERAAAEAAEEFARAWDEAHAEQARRAALNNAPAGEVGERLRNLDAEVTVSAGFERDKYAGYGTEYVKLVVFKLADGRVLKATGTARDLYGLIRGDKVRVTGTVKGFGEYQGQRQTILNRVKVEVVEAAAED